MTDNITFDNQLADYTDAILRGDSPAAPMSQEAEARTIRRLKSIIASEENVSPAFQARLNGVLDTEFAKHQGKKGQKRTPFNLQALYGLATAAALAIVFAVLTVIGFAGSDSLTGSANRPLTTTFAVFAISFAGILSLWIAYTRRR